MGRRKAKPIYAFHRFLEGIFSYYFDRGMPKNSAKLKMYKETYEVIFDFAKKEEDIPDHVLVATMLHASRLLNQRGYTLSKRLAKDKSNNNLRKELKNIKETKDVVDHFVSTYRGETIDE